MNYQDNILSRKEKNTSLPYNIVTSDRAPEIPFIPCFVLAKDGNSLSDPCQRTETPNHSCDVHD